MKPGDLDLCDLTNFEKGFPHEYFRVLRAEAPVLWHPAPERGQSANSIAPVTQGFYVVSRYADVVSVSRQPEIFSSQVGATNLYDPAPQLLADQQQILINMDPPRHVKYRRLVSRVFTPRMVALIEPRIRAHAERIVRAVEEKGECEFVTDIACELPLVLICEFLGIPVEDREQIFEWSNCYIGRDDPDYVDNAEKADQASIDFYLYNTQLAEKKRANPDDTLISRLLNEEVDGEKLSFHDFNLFVLLLAIAGNETTRNATSHGMRLLAEYPEQRELLQSDLEAHLPGFVEETLRFSPSVVHFRRTTTRETELHGVSIPAGAKVVIFYPSANRDEDFFDDPDRFDITRNPNPHLAFGIGEHYCLGANLARMQLRSIFRELLNRLPDIAVHGSPRRLRGNFIDGIKEMRVRYTKAAGEGEVPAR